jgi:plasmid stabilization system protein ParE
MSGYIVSPKADEDILEVWGYLYERAGIEVANHVEAEIYSAFETLARNPRIGHKSSDLTYHPVLFFAVYSYLIVYRPGKPLDIARVLHGKRDLRQILGEP